MIGCCTGNCICHYAWQTLRRLAFGPMHCIEVSTRRQVRKGTKSFLQSQDLECSPSYAIRKVCSMSYDYKRLFIYNACA